MWRYLGVVVALVGLAGCRGDEHKLVPSTLKQATLYGEDDLNRPIYSYSHLRRLVVIGPGAVETLFALGAGTSVIGRDQYAGFPAAARKIPIAGDFNGPNIEKTASLRPDLVIVQGETYDKGRCDAWQKQLGVPVAALAPADLKGVARGIRKLGRWTGHQAQGEALARRFEAAPGQNLGISALFETQRVPLMPAGGGTLLDDVLKRAGFSNAAGAVRGYKVFNLEALAAHPPDVYVVGDDHPDKARTLGDLRSTPGLKSLACVQKGRVLVVQSDLVYRPGPRLLDGVALLRREGQKLTKD